MVQLEEILVKFTRFYLSKLSLTFKLSIGDFSGWRYYGSTESL